MRRILRLSVRAIFCAFFFLTCSIDINSPALSATTTSARGDTARPAYVQLNARRTQTAAKFIYLGEDVPGLAVYNAVSGKLEASLPNHRQTFALAVNSVGDAYSTGDTGQFHSINTWTPELKEIAPTIKMSSPWALAVGGNGNLYVSTITYKNGSGIHTYTPQGLPASPTIPNVTAYGLAVDANNKIYALSRRPDRQAMTVLTYLPDGTPTTPTIQLNGCFPSAITSASLAVDSSGKIYVAAECDSQNFRGILTFTPNGAPTTPTITPSDSLLGFTLDSNGKIYVLGNSTITTYLSNGMQTEPTVTGISTSYSIAVY